VYSIELNLIRWVSLSIELQDNLQNLLIWKNRLNVVLERVLITTSTFIK